MQVIKDLPGDTLSKKFNECLQRYKLPEFDTAWGEIHRGIEKESLRISPDGHISLSSHPLALGSSLTNPFITTDFSESLLEFITPVYSDIDECLKRMEVKGAKCKKRIYFHSDCILQARSKVSTYHVQSGQVKR